MTTRAKFKVEEISQNSFGKTAKLVPVYSSDPNSENGKFYKQTPGGSISLTTINDTVAGQFEVGKEFYVDFTKVEA
jgi:hypothetical protein